MSIILIIKPKVIKQLFAFFMKGKRIYLAAVLRLLIGVILLIAASPQCKSTWVIITLGIFFLIAGVMIFALGLEKTKSILNWWNNKPLIVLRLVSLIPIAIGILLLYAS